MAITVAALYRALCARIPASLSCDWDNDGDMCIPAPDRHVHRILVTLDITQEAVDTAVHGGYDVVLSHHPLLFRGIKRLTSADPIGARCLSLCRCGVAALSFHTRLDALEDGVNAVLASLFSLQNVSPLVPDDTNCCAKIGELSEPMTLDAFCRLAVEKLGCPGVLVSDAHRLVQRVAVCGGEGGDFVPTARTAGADTYLSGRLGYHTMVDGPESGMNLIEAGHYYTEAPVLSRLAAFCAEIVPEATIDLFESNRIRFIGEAQS